MGRKREDLSHRTYGFWYIVKHIAGSMWLARCLKCNKTLKPLYSGNFKAFRSQQCVNCQMKQMGEALARLRTVHGLSKTRIYQRYRKLCSDYPNHEFRDIRHYQQTVGELDRRSHIFPADPNRPIGPDNYQILTGVNKNSLVYKGKGASQWARELGLSRQALDIRMNYGKGRTLEEAVELGPKMNPKQKRKHGKSNSDIYHVWCTHRYHMCEEWASSFETFYAAVGDRPKKRFLRRLDVDKLYEPGNVYWSKSRGRLKYYTKGQYVKKGKYNRKGGLYFKYDGKVVTLGELASLTGQPYSSLYYKLRNRRQSFPYPQVEGESHV